MSDEPERDAVEQVDHPGVLEEAAEQDEQEDVGRRHQHRDAEDALGAEEQLADDLIDAVPAVRDHAGQVLPEESVREEGRADDRQREAEHPARGLEHHHDEDRAHDQIGRAGIARALDQVRLEHQVIQRQRERRRRERRVVPGDALAVRPAGHRVDQEREREQEAHMDRAGGQARQRRIRRDDELVGRERQRDRGDDARGPARELALDAGLVERRFFRMGEVARFHVT